jgi:hypothetical protein
VVGRFFFRSWRILRESDCRLYVELLKIVRFTFSSSPLSLQALPKRSLRSASRAAQDQFT